MISLRIQAAHLRTIHHLKRKDHSVLLLALTVNSFPGTVADM